MSKRAKQTSSMPTAYQQHTSSIPAAHQQHTVKTGVSGTCGGATPGTGKKVIFSILILYMRGLPFGVGRCSCKNVCDTAKTVCYWYAADMLLACCWYAVSMLLDRRVIFRGKVGKQQTMMEDIRPCSPFGSSWLKHACQACLLLHRLCFGVPHDGCEAKPRDHSRRWWWLVSPVVQKI